jgi:hypothetical protein
MSSGAVAGVVYCSFTMTLTDPATPFTSQMLE